VSYQLANEIMVSFQRALRPSQEHIARGLHQPIAVYDSPSGWRDEFISRPY
jgi:hypothetical protein